jgi:hypothetical protein
VIERFIAGTRRANKDFELRAGFGLADVFIELAWS